jgi:hypothetical protein
MLNLSSYVISFYDIGDSIRSGEYKLNYIYVVWTGDFNCSGLNRLKSICLVSGEICFYGEHSGEYKLNLSSCVSYSSFYCSFCWAYKNTSFSFIRGDDYD